MVIFVFLRQHFGAHIIIHFVLESCMITKGKIGDDTFKELLNIKHSSLFNDNNSLVPSCSINYNYINSCFYVYV